MNALIAALVTAQATNDRFAECVLVPKIMEQFHPRRRVNQNTAGTPSERFWNKVAFGISDCWYWRGYLDPLGYGRITYPGENKAHRASYRMFCGEIPAGLKVLHRCDVRNCVNPEHLFLGTQADNVADMMAKRRGRNVPRFGEDNPMSALTASQVLAIRSDFAAQRATMRQLAKDYDVAVMTIFRIVRRQSWTNL